LNLENFELDHLSGLIKTKPVESITLLIASFSIAGLPLFGCFPLRQVLLENLAQVSLPVVLWSFAGMVGLMAGSVRILLAFIPSPGKNTGRIVNWQVTLLLTVGITVLLLAGLVPQWFTSQLFGLLNAFGKLV